MPLAQITLILSHYSSLSSIVASRSCRPVSIQNCVHTELVSIQNCCWLDLVGQSTLACPCERVHRRMSMMSSSLLLQQSLACLVCLIWMVLEIGGWWPHNCCVGWCFQDLFNIDHSIHVQFPSSFFSIRLASIHVVHPYSSIDTTAVWMKSHFISSDQSDFDMIDSLLIVVHAFARHILTSLSVDETLLLRFMNLSTNFREPQFKVGMSSSWLKHMYSI